MVKFIYNNVNNAATKYIFFELNYRYYFYILFKINTNLYFKFELIDELDDKLKNLIPIFTKIFTILKNFKNKFKIKALSIKAISQITKSGLIANTLKLNKIRS